MFLNNNLKGEYYTYSKKKLANLAILYIRWNVRFIYILIPYQNTLQLINQLNRQNLNIINLCQINIFIYKKFLLDKHQNFNGVNLRVVLSKIYSTWGGETRKEVLFHK